MEKLKTVPRKRFNLLQNPFDVQTRQSFGKMLSVASKTYSILKGMQALPFYSELFAELHPQMLAYRDLYQQIFIQHGNKKSNTLGLRLMMKELNRTKLPQWEGQVRVLYIEDSPDEVAIFPNKRRYFQSGPYASRIKAVGALAQTLLSYPALAATQADVQLWYDRVLDMRNQQLGSKGAHAGAYDNLETQRVLLADTLYGIMGRLMHYHKTERNMIDNYFDFHRLFGARKKYVEVEGN